MTVDFREKKCRECHKIYPATKEYFNERPDSKDGFRNTCRNCRKIQMKKYNDLETSKIRQSEHRKKPEKKQKHRQQQYAFNKTLRGKHIRRRSDLRNKFGLSIGEYNRLYVNQDGKCAICGKHQSELRRRLSVDHDHKTGKVRGLLCIACNWHLGLFEKGRKCRIDKAIKMIKYLGI